MGILVLWYGGKVFITVTISLKAGDNDAAFRKELKKISEA